MPDPKKYNLDYRPEDYFHEDIDKNAELISGVATDDIDQAALTRHPPMFFGGCCLPGLSDNEVEIARVRLESTTFDIISVRARLQNGKIHYSVADEYEGQTEYTCNPEVSDQPLTMAELIDLMENTDVDLEYSGLVLGMIQHNLECPGDAEQWVHFANVTSDIYPQLGEWYFEATEEWYEANREEPQAGPVRRG